MMFMDITSIIKELEMLGFILSQMAQGAIHLILHPEIWLANLPIFK